MKYQFKTLLFTLTILSSQNILFAQTNENFECHIIEQGGLNYPELAELADFDGDGLLDIFVGTSRGIGEIDESDGTSHVAWFKNLGDGTYEKHPILVPNARHSYVHDYDNDGDPDILIGRTKNLGSRATTQIQYFENDGSANFSSKFLFSRSNTRLFDLRIADFNNDGLMDFYSLNDEYEYERDNNGNILNFDERGYKLEFYRNNGSNDFSRFYIGAEDHVDTDIIFAETAFGDFDGDLDIDIVVRDWNTSFDEYNAYVFLYDGIDDFQRITLPESRLGNMNSIQVSDVDNDGDLDISTLRDMGEYFWYKNDGAANFTQEFEFVSRLEFEADIDRDGDIDRYSSRNRWQENIGNNEFLSSERLIDDNLSASLIDVDEDGDLDIIASQYHFSTSESHKVNIYLNDGEQNYSKVEPALDGNLYWAESIEDVDLDQDGDVDVLGVSKTEGNLFWYKNDGNGNFTKFFISESVENIVEIGFADFDLDGDIDILSLANSSEGIDWWQNNGNQEFTKFTIFGTDGLEFIDVRIIDINKDNYPDFIAQDLENESIDIFLNDPQSTFITFEQSSLINNIKASSLELIDINNNGFEDLIVSDESTNQLLLFLNNEGANFIPQQLGSINGYVDDIEVVDIEQDGDWDIVTASHQNGSLDLWVNFGGENFEIFNISSDEGFGAITLLDYDNDGDLDLITSNFDEDDYSLKAWINNQGYSFMSEIIDQTFFNGRDLKATDINGDGNLDILAASNGSGIKWYKNSASISSNTLFINCPPDITIESPLTNPPVEYDLPQYFSDCNDGSELSLISGPNSGDAFDQGGNLIIYEATDMCGSEAQRCSLFVTVQLRSTLVIECPADLILFSENFGPVVGNWDLPTYETDCENQEVTIEQIGGLANGSEFQGQTPFPITYRITDACGSMEECTFAVGVTEAPTLDVFCPEDTILNTFGTSAIATWDEPTFETTCPDQDLINIEQVAGLTNGSSFPIGTTIISYEFSNECDNIETCSFNVIVQQDSELLIDCPEDIIVSSTGEPVVVNYNVDLSTSTCTEEGFNLTLFDSPPSGAEFEAGTTTTITHIAFDNCGNEDTCRFDIIVELVQEVTLTCPDDIILSSSGDPVVVIWDDPTFATDCITQGFILEQVSGPSSGSEFEIGTTEISYDFIDGCGNPATCSFEVIVQDLNATISISCPDDIYLQSSGGAVKVFWQIPSYETTCSDNFIVLSQDGNAPLNGGFFEIGTTTVSYSATDLCDNSSSCSFDVIIEKVEVDCPDDINGFQYIGNFEGDRYFISNDIKSWEEANQIAQLAGGHLVSINSVEENNFVYNNINEIAFIGFNDSETEGTFKWSNGQAPTFGNLTDFNTNTKDYAYINFWNGTWNLGGSFQERKFLMEIDCDSYSSCNISANLNKVECDEENLFFDLTVSGFSGVTEWKAIIYGEEYTGDYNVSTLLGPFSTNEAQEGLDFVISDMDRPCNTTVSVDVPQCPGVTACPEELDGYSFLGAFGGHKYFISDILTTWPKANEMAQANDGHLVSINNVEENSFIENLIFEYVFIGLSDSNNEGIEEWTSGDLLTYTNYTDNTSCFFCSPNTEENDYAHMNFWNGGWNFDGPWVERRHVIEFDCGGSGGGFNIGDSNDPVIVPRLEEEKEIMKSTITIFPNPVLDQMIIDIESVKDLNEEILVFDARGALIFTKEIYLKRGANQVQLDVTKYTEAMYFLKFKNLLETRRFVKKN